MARKNSLFSSAVEPDSPRGSSQSALLSWMYSNFKLLQQTVFGFTVDNLPVTAVNTVAEVELASFLIPPGALDPTSSIEFRVSGEYSTVFSSTFELRVYHNGTMVHTLSPTKSVDAGAFSIAYWFQLADDVGVSEFVDYVEAVIPGDSVSSTAVAGSTVDANEPIILSFRAALSEASVATRVTAKLGTVDTRHRFKGW